MGGAGGTPSSIRAARGGLVAGRAAASTGDDWTSTADDDGAIGNGEAGSGWVSWDGTSSSAIACQNLSGIVVWLAGSSGDLELVGHTGEFGIGDVGLVLDSFIAFCIIGCSVESGISWFGRDELFDVYFER